MRIAIASDDQQHIAAHTGRCGGFVIYEIIDGLAKRIEFRANRFTHHAQGDCGAETHAHEGKSGHSHTALLDALADCQALISRGMGPRLMTDLSRNGIEAAVCTEAEVERAALLFAEDTLTRLPGGSSGCTRGGD